MTEIARKPAPKSKTGKVVAPKVAIPKSPAKSPVTAAVAVAKPAGPRAAVARAAPATARKPASSAVAKSSPAKRAAPAAKASVEPAPGEVKPVKSKKAKLVRDSFTMPETEYAAIAALKKRCLSLGVAAKKSEVLRAAISCLAKLSDLEVADAIQGLDRIKTGRPAKGGR